MKNLMFYVLVALATTLSLYSCADEYATIESSNENEVLLKSGNNEAQFRTYLRGLVNLFEQANTNSNGELAQLLESISSLPSEEAKAQLANSGLIDFTILERLVNDADALQDILEKELGIGIVDGIINEETGGMQLFGGPFWGNGDCQPAPGYGTEPIFNVGDGGCYVMKICKKFRFWIHWGGWTAPFAESVPC